MTCGCLRSLSSIDVGDIIIELSTDHDDYYATLVTQRSNEFNTFDVFKVRDDEVSTGQWRQIIDLNPDELQILVL